MSVPRTPTDLHAEHELERARVHDHDRHERAIVARENRRHQARYDDLHASRALWIRCFNRLEKAVTNHIDNCIDADDLAHAHRAVMRDLGPQPQEEAPWTA